MDFRLSVLALALVLSLPAHAQQIRRDAGASSQADLSRQAPQGDVIRQPQTRRHRAPRSERCANLATELRDARRAEREASTTTASDQASLRRQQLLEQSQKAGC